MTCLRWLQEGASIPKGHRLVQVLMRERRTVGTGTNTAEFFLCEIEESSDECLPSLSLRERSKTGVSE